MDRTQLLETLTANGLAEEAANQIIENISKYLETTKARLIEQHNIKTAQAKRIVLAETAKWKARMAQRISVFLESKVAVVENQIRRQTGLNESAAVAELQKLKSMLVNNQSTESQQLTAKIAQLEEQITKLNTAKANLTEQYQKMSKITKQAIHNVKQTEKALAESKLEHEQTKKLLSESQSQSRDNTRSEAVTGTVLNEDNIAKPQPRKKKPAQAASSDSEVDQIANLI